MPYVLRVTPPSGGPTNTLWVEGYGEALNRAKEAIDAGCDPVEIYEPRLIWDHAQIQADIAKGGIGQGAH